MIKNALVQNKKRQWGLIRHARRSSKLQTSCWCETEAELKVLPHRASLPLTCCRAAEQRVSLEFLQETIKQHKDSSPNRNDSTFNISNKETVSECLRLIWGASLGRHSHEMLMNIGNMHSDAQHWMTTAASCVLDERDTLIRKRLFVFWIHRFFSWFFH